MRKVLSKNNGSNVALVITTIAAPNKCLKLFSNECKKREIDFIVVGDKKSPAEFDLAHTHYFSFKQQQLLDFSLAKVAPANHYSRKNIGYLLAMQRGAKIIIETDDDNFPYSSFWNYSNQSRAIANQTGNAGWINIYKAFTKRKIYPRGFPLDLVDSNLFSFDSLTNKKLHTPIQQGLANIDADVDAVYRMTENRKIKFANNVSIALSKNEWCPFNSQNTRWYKEAFMLMYLPATCSSRLTDIWRSFIAQRICFENNWSILFHSPTVYHKRNHHNLLQDFKEEFAGYLNNDKIKTGLEKLKLKGGDKHLSSNMLKCYEWFVQHKLLKEKEIGLLECWIRDVKRLSK